MNFHINLSILILAKKDQWDSLVEYLTTCLNMEHFKIKKDSNSITIWGPIMQIKIYETILESARGYRWDTVFYDPEIIDINSSEFNCCIRPKIGVYKIRELIFYKK